MIINVFPYKIAKEKAKESQYKSNWISIRDYGYEHVYNELDTHANNVLKLYFDDLTEFNVKHDLIHPIYKKIQQEREFILFSKEQAKQIYEFASIVDKRHEILNIHCWAGKSRSQAVGYALNNFFNLFLKHNTEDYIHNLKQCQETFMPNPDVLKILNQELYFLK